LQPLLDISRQMSLNRHRNVMLREILVMFRGLAVTAILVGATMSLPFSAALAEDLTQTEIRDELIGRQIVWWEDGGWQSGHLTLGLDGQAELSVERPRQQLDVGRWTLRDDELCTEWSAMRSGLEKCYRVRRDEQGRFVTSGGNVFEIREAGV
jgi:hypothetical protein